MIPLFFTLALGAIGDDVNDTVLNGGQFQLGAQTTANLELTPKTIDLALKLDPIPVTNNESAALYCETNPTGVANQSTCLYGEVTGEQQDTEAGWLKLIHYGAGDAVYIASFNNGPGLETACFFDGCRGQISTLQIQGEVGAAADFANSTLFQGVWGWDGTGGSNTAPLYGAFYNALSLGRSFSVRLHTTGADGFAWNTPEFLIRDNSLARTHWEVQNNGNQIMAEVAATVGSTTEAAPYLTLRGSYYSGSASDKDIDLVPQMDGSGNPSLALQMGSSGAEVVELLVSSTDMTVYNNAVLSNVVAGGDYNSHTLTLQGNNLNGSNYTGDATIQLMIGNDPYLRLAVDDDLSAGNGSLTAVMDLYNDQILFPNDDTVSIGSAASSRPKNIYHTGIYMNYVRNIAVDDATPDVSGGSTYFTQDNTGATAITDLDNPTAGQRVSICIGGTGANASTISNSGNFRLQGDWEPDLYDCIQLLVYQDNNYWEIGRSTKSFSRNIPIEAGSARLGPTSPTHPEIVDSGGVVVAHALGFDSTAGEAVILSTCVPPDWDGASDWTLRVKWTNENGDALADTEDVDWYARWRTVADEEAHEAAAVTSAPVGTYTQSGAGTDSELMATDITIDYDDATNPLTVGDCLYVNFQRNIGATESNSYSGDASVIKWIFIYTSTEHQGF